MGQVHWLDWLIMIAPTILIVGLAIYTRKYVRGVADFLAAGRVAGRYVLSVGELSSGLSVITLIGLVEAQYRTGFAVSFWGRLMAPLSLVFALTGFVVYRWRETKALSFGQFLEMRYNRPFRIFASSLRTITEIIANALGPAIAANFFIYFLGLPHSINIFGLNLPCFAILLIILMILAITCLWPGGRVSLLLTDTLQGILSYPIFVIIVGYVIYAISWSGEMAPTMADRVAGENFLNPFDVARLRDFNIFALAVTIFGSILNRASWFGNDTTNCGKTPHEQKMAGVLGAWRNGFSTLMFTVVAVMVITVMNHRNFAPEAKEIRDSLSEHVAEETIPDTQQRARIVKAAQSIPVQEHRIGIDPPLSRAKNLDTPVLNAVQNEFSDSGEGHFGFQRFKTMYQQQMVTLTLKRTLPVGIIGLFGLLMIMLVLSTDDSRIFNASSTLVQDIVIPLRKKALSPKEHLLWLRLSSVGVGVFFVIFSLSFVQVDFVNMFLAIVCSIWLGGAGPVMIFGLYSRFGNTTGAFSSVFVGSGISLAGMVMQLNWAKHIYPFLADNGWVDAVGTWLTTISSPFAPIIEWNMSPEKFPINSYEIYFIAMLAGLLAYIAGSVLTYKKPYNLDRLLHRGIYNIDGDDKNIESVWTLKNFFSKVIGITPDYTRGDKIITWAVFIYSFVYLVLFAFVGVIIWNMIYPWPAEWWATYFFVTTLIGGGIVGIISTVWFMWGGIRDSIRLFRDLKGRIDNPLDDGRVEGNISLADKDKFEHLK